MINRRWLYGLLLLTASLSTGCCRLYDRWCNGPCYNRCNPCYASPANACYPQSGLNDAQARFPPNNDCR